MLKMQRNFIYIKECKIMEKAQIERGTGKGKGKGKAFEGFTRTHFIPFILLSQPHFHFPSR